MGNEARRTDGLSDNSCEGWNIGTLPLTLIIPGGGSIWLYNFLYEYIFKLNFLKCVGMLYSTKY